MEERRKFPRIEYRQPVQYQRADTNTVEGCVAFDLSEGGLRFRAEDFIGLNTEVFCDIPLEGEQTVRMTGRIMWVQKVPHAENYHVGLEFVDNSSTLESKIPLGKYLKEKQVNVVKGAQK